MKRISLSIAGLLLSLGMSAASWAYTITYNHDLAANGNDFISPYANAPTPSPTVINLLTQDFEGSPAGISGNYALVTGPSAGFYAPPFGATLPDLTQYITVPKNSGVTPLSATLSFGGQTYDYLGLWWGSIDSYNTLSFIKNNSVVQAFTGSQLPAPSIANGAQNASNSNQYLNFYGISFDSIMFTSTQYAFEVDNVAVGNVVPEPGTMVLLGLGMFGLAFYSKRRMNKEA